MSTCDLPKKQVKRIKSKGKSKTEGDKKSADWKKKGQKNTKRVKQRDQRTDLVPGAALEGLLGRFLTLVDVGANYSCLITHLP